MLEEPDQVQTNSYNNCESHQLKKLKIAAEEHIRGSKRYLPALRSMSEPCGSEKNTSPWKTLEGGSYYLMNAYSLVETYKDCVPGPDINDEYIQSVNNMLITLQFDPKHGVLVNTDGALNKKADYFVSQNRSAKYYDLLHSEAREDVRSFVEIVELNIDSPVEKFLESINCKCEALESPSEPGPSQSQANPESKLGQLHKLKNAAEVHIKFSEFCLRMLQTMLEPLGSGTKPSPRKALEEGSYYLRNAYYLVNVYEVCFPGPINDEFIQKVNELLILLEFDPNHISVEFTYENHGGWANRFVCRGSSARYYELLHSGLTENVRLFLKLVKLTVEIPVKKFLESINCKCEALESPSEPGPSQSQANPESELDHLKKLKNAAEAHIKFSKLHLPVLQGMSQPLGSGTNPSPLKTLEEGFYYLRNAYYLVKVYADCFPGPINNEFIRKVCKLLVSLDFDPNHINLEEFTLDASGRWVQRFVCKGVGTKYYELLHSDLKRDVRLFLARVELDIEFPIKKFLESVICKCEALKIPSPTLSLVIPKSELDQLTKLKYAAEVHIEFSKIYLPSLERMTQPQGLSNPSPPKTLKEGSYYLKNAYYLVQVYKDGVSGPINDANSSNNNNDVLGQLIQKVNEILISLEFDPNHISSGFTDEADGGRAKFFVSKGQGTKYYELLHSDLKKDVISFLAIAKKLELPVKRFLELVNCKSKSWTRLRKAGPAQSLLSPECKWGQLKKLKNAAEDYMLSSEIFLPLLEQWSELHGPEKNADPLRTLEFGSYYLNIAYKLVRLFKDCVPGPINNECMLSVNDTLVALEFDPEHIISSVPDIVYRGRGMVESFVSRGQGTKYFKLLHSELTHDVRLFIDMVKTHIDVPARTFRKSIDERLQSAYSCILF